MNGERRSSRRVRVIVFDDVMAARGEQFRVPGLSVEVYAHADDAVALCTMEGYEPDIVFMDFSMGSAHDTGDKAVGDLRAAGYKGRIVAISSDPESNARMESQGADETLARKAHVGPFLIQLAKLR